MKFTKAILALILALISATIWPAEGYILKANEGESLLNGIVVKASPKTGTERSIMVEQTFQLGGKTVLHLHEQGDELFYVVSGRGTVKLGGVYESIGIGDVILVPADAIHQIENPNHDNPLVVVFFMDTPELADLFRAIHHRVVSEPDRPITPDEIAEIEKQTGGGRTVN